MKTKFLLPVLAASALVAFNLNVLADDNQGDDDSQDECQISGQETMDAVVVLTATPNAPAGATGIAKIESENDDGNEAASMEVKTSGLTPGDYVLSITLQSTGTNIILGGFTVSSNDDENDDDQGENQDSLRLDMGEHWIGCDWGGFTNWGSWTNCNATNWCSGNHGDDNENDGEQSEFEVDLPADVNPTDLAQITVSDTDGNPILVGELVNPAPTTVINVNAAVQLTPGTASPSVVGTAQVRSTAAKGHWKHQFSLVASGVGAKSTFKLSVNGKISGAAKSDKTGQMKVKKLPSHVPALRSLRLLDAQGNVAASAKF